jgi:hypothetical protein
MALKTCVFITGWIFDLDEEIYDMVSCKVAEEVYEYEEKEIRNDM